MVTDGQTDRQANREASTRNERVIMLKGTGDTGTKLRVHLPVYTFIQCIYAVDV